MPIEISQEFKFAILQLHSAFNILIRASPTLSYY